LYLNKYYMRVVNYTEFRNTLAESLNAVNDDGDIVVVSRSKGKNVVVMSLDEYNSMKETLYLTSTKANRQNLDAAIDEMNKGKFTRRKLIEK
jgi:antitoxin YefM